MSVKRERGRSREWSGEIRKRRARFIAEGKPIMLYRSIREGLREAEMEADPWRRVPLTPSWTFFSFYATSFLWLSSFAARIRGIDRIRCWKKTTSTRNRAFRLSASDLPLTVASPDSMNSALVVIAGGRDEQWFVIFGDSGDSAGVLGPVHAI